MLKKLGALSVMLLCFSVTLSFAAPPPSSDAAHPPVLMLPGAYTTAPFYEINGDAGIGAQVRATGHPFFVMDSTDTASMEDYEARALSVIERLEVKFRSRVILAGYSYGGVVLHRLVSAYPQRFAGVAIFESLGVAHSMEIKASMSAKCAYYRSQVAIGKNWEENGQMLKTASDLMLSYPLLPSPFLPMLNNEQFVPMVMTSHTPTDPPRWVAVSSGLFPGTYAFLNKEIIVQFADTSKLRESNEAFAGVYCGVSHGDAAFSDGLADYGGPVIAFGGERAFGPYMEASLQHFTHAASIEMHLFPGEGHLDIMLSKAPGTNVVQGWVSWLKRNWSGDSSRIL